MVKKIVNKKSVVSKKTTTKKKKPVVKKKVAAKKKIAKKKSVSVKKINLQKPIVWTSNMSVEEKTIDGQHQNLVKTINQLIKLSHAGEELKKIRDTIHFLEFYAVEHFGYEEDYMKRIKYPGLKVHVKIHKGLVVFLLSFKNQLTRALYLEENQALVSENVSRMLEELRQYLGKWLISHLLGEDQKYHRYAKKEKLIDKDLSKAIWKDLKKNKRKISDIKLPSVSKQTKGGANISEIASRIRNQFGEGGSKSIDLEVGTKTDSEKFIFTGIEGFDKLLINGIPVGNSVIIAGGAGSGKTIFCLQSLVNKAKKGKKCLYLTLEEDEQKLVQHMEEFGWPAKKLIKKKLLKVVRMNPFDITRNVDALLAKQKGELLIDIDPVFLPKEYSKPDFIVIDSLTAIASAFTGKEDTYRIYIEQLFRFLQQTKATSFLITETEQVPKIFSETGVEEFLADGVVVLYSIRHGNVRENAIEILKLRGASHQKRIVAMQVTENGIVVYPEQEVFSDI